MPNGVDNLLDAAGKLVEVIPTAYEDLLQPAVKETGQIIAKLPKAINAALIGVDCWVEEKKYKLDETKKLLEHKLQNVDPDKIVPPEHYVAIPALQAISYSMDSEELRDLYANLLANAMNIDTKNSVHPAFVELIKQLSPYDAHVLKEFNTNARLPLVNYQLVLKNNRFLPIHSNVIICNYSTNIEANSIAITNLDRLGIVRIESINPLSDKSSYDVFKTEPTYLKYKDIISKIQAGINPYCFKDVLPFPYTWLNGVEDLRLAEHFVEVTPLGKSFINCCL